MKKSEKIRIAVIGTGERSTTVVGHLLKDKKRAVKIVSVYDPDQEEMERATGIWEQPDAKLCNSYKEAIQTPGVDWVMIFSPNSHHCEHILEAFKNGKNVFSEKPLATTIKDCQAIYSAQQKSGCTFATGFVLRYAPLYRAAKEVLDSGKLGKILSINADENIDPHHGAYIMTNWRRLSCNAGPHILEKCCHDLDLLNWFCGSLPSKVAAFGSLDFFVPANKNLYKKYPVAFTGWRDPHKTKENAFTSDKDMLDTQVCIAQYRNGIKVHFQATMSNVIPERRMYFSCTQGSLIVEQYSGTLQYRSLSDTSTHTMNNFVTAGGHNGGDSVITKELYDVMIHGGQPKCSGSEGLESAVFALSLDQAMRENKIIDLEPVWKKLKR